MLSPTEPCTGPLALEHRIHTWFSGYISLGLTLWVLTYLYLMPTNTIRYSWCKMYDLASFPGSHAPEHKPWSCAGNTYSRSRRAWERGYVWYVYYTIYVHVACMCRAHVARQIDKQCCYVYQITLPTHVYYMRTRKHHGNCLYCAAYSSPIATVWVLVSTWHVTTSAYLTISTQKRTASVLQTRSTSTLQILEGWCTRDSPVCSETSLFQTPKIEDTSAF